MNNLLFYREHKDAIIPSKKRLNDAGYDLYSIERITIMPNERKLVPIGLRIICPNNFFYTFAPRSGLAFNDNIIPSHFNVMDSNYTGDCSILMFNRSNKAYTIEKNERFCQLIIHQLPPMNVQEIDVEQFKQQQKLKKERLDDGFGSSGKF